MTLYERCAGALAARLRQLRPALDWIPGYPGYAANLADNLVEGVPADFEPDYREGAGQELESARRSPPKMHAAHSSSALVVNTFAR